MSKAKPLTAEQCEAAREAMLTGHSLSKISRCAGVVATIEYMNIVRRELKVHISHLCYILCTAAEDYYKNNKEKFDFIKYSIEDDRPKTFL